MAPAWGVIGNALTDAATGYLEAINKMPSEKLARRKAELENLKLEEDTALSRARAAAAARVKGQFVSNKHGVWQYDPETGELKSIYEAPPTEERDPGKVAKWLALKGLEQKLGKPQSEFTYQDQLNPDPDVQGLWDRFHGRSNITIVPGVGPYLTRDVRGGATAPSPTTPTTEPAVPPAPKARTPAGKQPVVDPSLPIVNGPPVSTEPLRTSTPGGVATKPPAVDEAQSDPKIVKYYDDRFKKIPQAQADKEIGALLKTKGIKPPQVASALESYHRTYGVHAPGVSEVQEPTTQPSPSATPPDTPAPGERAAKPPAPAQPAGSPRVVQPLITSPAQQEDQARKRFDDERKAEQLRLQQQGLTLQQQEAKLRELDRQEDNRRADAQLKLSEARTAAYLKELETANTRKDEAAAARVEQNVLRETREARGMIQGADETIALIHEMRRYISPETVGVRGAVRSTVQSLWGQLDSPARQPQAGRAGELQQLVMARAGAHMQEADKFAGTWQLEENARAKAEGREPNKIYVPDYSKYGYDPRMRFIDFLKEVIAYAHARAMNGPGRLTDQDLNRAQKSLGIDGWMNSAADMQTSIGYVEKQLMAKKARAQAYAKSVEAQLRKHRPGAVEGEAEPVPAPKED